jgi:hypothetical protein
LVTWENVSRISGRKLVRDFHARFFITWGASSGISTVGLPEPNVDRLVGVQVLRVGAPGVHRVGDVLEPLRLEDAGAGPDVAGRLECVVRLQRHANITTSHRM